MQTITIDIHLDADRAAVLARFMVEHDRMMQETSAELLRRRIIDHDVEPISQSEALQMLVYAALDRERKIQQLQDDRADPPWLRAAVRQAMDELGAH